MDTIDIASRDADPALLAHLRSSKALDVVCRNADDSLEMAITARSAIDPDGRVHLMISPPDVRFNGEAFPVPGPLDAAAHILVEIIHGLGDAWSEAGGTVTVRLLPC